MTEMCATKAKIGERGRAISDEARGLALRKLPTGYTPMRQSLWHNKYTLDMEDRIDQIYAVRMPDEKLVTEQLNVSPFIGRSGLVEPHLGPHRFLLQRLFNLSGQLICDPQHLNRFCTAAGNVKRTRRPGQPRKRDGVADRAP